MAKDPAFLFYPGDWLGGTMGMTFEEKGAYMELLIFQFNRGAFKEKTAMSILQGKKELWETLNIKFIQDENGCYFNEKLKMEQEKRKAYTESRRQSRLKSDEDKVRIYIVCDNVRKTYKIGSSVNPIRRYNELNKQQSPAIMLDKEPKNRNISLIWYSDIVNRNEEKKIHKEFEDKRIIGEWFDLSANDLKWIFNNYKGKHYERTFQRTEIENEDVNEILIEVIKYLNTKTKNNFSYHSRNTQQLIMDRMEEKFTLKDFIKVIDNKCAEWLNTEYAKWLRPETLFSVEHFDSYLQNKSSTMEILDMDTN